MPRLRDTAGAVAGSAVLESGVVFEHTRVLDRTATEVLTAGDVIDLRAPDGGVLLPGQRELVAHTACSLVVVPAERPGGPPLPIALRALLLDRQAERCRRTSRQLAILQLPRIEDRVLAVFCELAERIGRVTADGVVISLPLTHRTIGSLVGGRRPTVSLALTALAGTGVLTRRPEGTWVLAHRLVAVDGDGDGRRSAAVTPGPRHIAA